MSEKQAHPVHLPRGLSRSITDAAHRLDRSLSWCVQRAWSVAGPTLISTDKAAPHGEAETAFAALAGGDAKEIEHSFFFPQDMIAEIESEASRTNHSFSWVVQRAWSLAVNKL